MPRLWNILHMQIDIHTPRLYNQRLLFKNVENQNAENFEQTFSSVNLNAEDGRSHHDASRYQRTRRDTQRTYSCRRPDHQSVSPHPRRFFPSRRGSVARFRRHVQDDREGCAASSRARVSELPGNLTPPPPRERPSRSLSEDPRAANSRPSDRSTHEPSFSPRSRPFTILRRRIGGPTRRSAKGGWTPDEVRSQLDFLASPTTAPRVPARRTRDTARSRIGSRRVVPQHASIPSVARSKPANTTRGASTSAVSGHPPAAGESRLFQSLDFDRPPHAPSAYR